MNANQGTEKVLIWSIYM